MICYACAYIQWLRLPTLLSKVNYIAHFRGVLSKEN